jgi:catalase
VGVGKDPRGAERIERAETLTTNQGLPIADNQNSLKAVTRGPTLLEDFILREKITSFDHERIPERIVHARGSGAHGFFEAYESQRKLTRAQFLQDPKVRTPVFVRFSTVVGGAGSADTVRDVRGFAVKFYTADGNFDLVGNNVPVFFIQDAMKFPDFVHAAKPEPHRAIPQASSAHDTFWDFVSLTPESLHAVMWAMSDRGIPRSYRMMQGFGVHTFRFVNDAGEVHRVKFHWKPLLGTHALAWEEAQLLAGKDADFHRRDLWDAIEAGAHPEYELGVQLIPEEDAEEFAVDLLDPTKLVPEELVPVTPLGRMVLDRNPDNFFAETEQAAFHPAHIVPGIDFTDDPLLQGRLFSYLDTQLIRLGGPNFHELPINRSHAPVQNLQRDGFMRHTIHPGRIAYEPSGIDGGSPRQASAAAGFASYAAPARGTKLRDRSASFFDHYSQARLFWNSQSTAEQDHIVAAFQFELGKVEVPAVRQRVADMLQNVAPRLAERVVEALGIQLGKPPETQSTSPVLDASPALSMRSHPGAGIATRKVAVLVAEGFEAAEVRALRQALEKEGASAVLIAPRLGPIEPREGAAVGADHGIATASSVQFDAVAVPSGAKSLAALAAEPAFIRFVQEAHRHAKALLIGADGAALLGAAGIDAADASRMLGVIASSRSGFAKGELAGFVDAIAAHRHWARVP